MARTKTSATSTAVKGSGATKKVAPENQTEIKDVVEKVDKKDNKKVVAELVDSDEIEVVSLIPNVSYEDKQSGDFYEWENEGEVQLLTFGTLKNMWRNYKKYFRNFVLRINDDRVIDRFGLTAYYKQYDFMLDAKNYTSANMDKIVGVFKDSTNDVRFALERQIRGFVTSGKISNTNIIRELQSKLNIDLISYI